MEIPEIKPKEVYGFITKGDEIIILDVRTKEEFDEGYIKTAINLPLDNLEGDILKIIPNKNSKVYVYCHSGVRSEAAVEYMMKHGYKNVFNMTGGIAQWESENLPIVT
ncbi:rhodanese-like domain-containing protein [Candidatus Shapirobacteria bacterium]|nr:rhodanese-like domain-containing protein [Candidatus Shapirobacteria bacterium]